MSIYVDRAKELRAIDVPHYNCAQGVLVPFAERAGISADDAYAIGQAFGRGMQTGNVCGAVTGALMALGAIGAADPETVQAVIKRMRDNHGGVITCDELLRKNEEAGGDRHVHCDGLVFEAVSIVEEYLKAKEEA